MYVCANVLVDEDLARPDLQGFSFLFSSHPLLHCWLPPCQQREKQNFVAASREPGATGGVSVEMTARAANTKESEHDDDLSKAEMELEGALQPDQITGQSGEAVVPTAQRSRNGNDSFDSESAQDDATDDDSYDSDFDDSVKAERLEQNHLRL